MKRSLEIVDESSGKCSRLESNKNESLAQPSLDVNNQKAVEELKTDNIGFAGKSKNEIFYTSQRFGRTVFYVAPHNLLKRTQWSKSEEIQKGRAIWSFCTPVVKDNQLFISHVRGKKLPDNFSFLSNMDLLLAGCARPEIDDIEGLAEFGAKMLLTLSEETEHHLGNIRFKLSQFNISHLCYPTPNGGAPSLDDIEVCVSAIQECVSTNGLAVVHCHAGEGRTGVVLACYLCRHKGMSPEQAIAYLQTNRHRSLQGYSNKDNNYINNTVQTAQLKKYWKFFCEDKNKLSSSSSSSLQPSCDVAIKSASSSSS